MPDQSDESLLVGEELWNKFNKRELIAARMLERLVAANGNVTTPGVMTQRDIEELPSRLPALAVALTDSLLAELYPVAPSDL